MGRWNEIHASAVAEAKAKAESAPKVIEHELYICPGNHDHGCQFCDGGLSACTKCGAFEGMWPDDCPGEQMTPVFGDAVYEGRLNYRAGYWRFECCQVMRHIHDVTNFMAEAGYVWDIKYLQWKKVADV